MSKYSLGFKLSFYQINIMMWVFLVLWGCKFSQYITQHFKYSNSFLAICARGKCALFPLILMAPMLQAAWELH